MCGGTQRSMWQGIKRCAEDCRGMHGKAHGGYTEGYGWAHGWDFMNIP